MSGALVHIEFESAKLTAALRRAAEQSRDMGPAWRSIGEHMLRSVDKTFDAQGRPARWDPLQRSTWEGRLGGRRRMLTKKGGLRAAAKRRLGSDKILTASARLRRSITYRAGSQDVLVGTNTIYGAIHHFGGPAGRKNARVNIPARPYLVVQPEDEDAMAEIIEEHVGGSLR